MLLCRSNFVTLKFYQWNIFKPLNNNNLQVGRFINPDVFYVPHIDTKVLIDKWTSTVTTVTFTGLTNNVAIFSSDT